MILFFLLSVSTYAQYGNPQYGNNNRFGMQNNYPTQSKPSAEDIEKDKSERINKYMEKLKKELSLDELQFIAIQNEIIANSRKIDIVMKKEKSEDEKAKEINYLIGKLDSDISVYLNNEQKEKYLILKEEKGAKKKDKSSKNKDKVSE